MKVALIGVGQAGGKVTQALAEYDYEMDFGAVTGALAVNTAEPDLQELEIDTMLIGQDRVKGHGVGGDNELGAEIMQDESEQVLDGLDGRITTEAEAIFVVAGLGGGTGSGGAPVLLRELQTIYDVPIYAMGILPGRGEGSMYQANAGRSLKTVLREADATLLIDNDAWHDAGESVEAAFDRINQEIARRVGLLLAAGEPVTAGEGVLTDGNTRDVGAEDASTVVDSSEVINTLRNGGIATLGYAVSEASEDAAENVNVVTSLARNALFTGTSLPDATTADAALFVVAGDPDRIPRKGVERARRWLEDETGSMQVRGGDFPLDSEHLAALVLLGGAERSDRVKEFMERARQAQREQEPSPDEPAEQFQNDDLEDLF